MDRRGFLGVLAALPIVRGMVPQQEQEIAKETIDKVLNLSIDDPVWSGVIPSYSGVQYYEYVGSGTYDVK